MIYSIKGKIVDTQLVDTYYIAVVECNNIGYSIKTTHTSMSAIDKQQEVMFYTYLYVREDALELFGFNDKTELNCFKQLISVSGVGPKVALAILSSIDPAGFAMSVASGDAKTIAKAKGVGAKVSQRIVLELRDKISKEQLTGTDNTLPSNSISTGVTEEAISALNALGYSRAEAMHAIAGASPDSTVEQLIKHGLKSLAG